MIRPSSKVIVKFLQVMQRHGTFPAPPPCPSSTVSERRERPSQPRPTPPTFGMITRRWSLSAPRSKPFKLPINYTPMRGSYTFSEIPMMYNVYTLATKN
jgi:hypothetical protein